MEEQGTLDAAHAVQTYVKMIDPDVQSATFSVKSADNSISDQSPVIVGVRVLDAFGITVQEWGPEFNSGESAAELVTVPLDNSLAGGQIQVTIARGGSVVTEAGPGTATNSPTETGASNSATQGLGIATSTGRQRSAASAQSPQSGRVNGAVPASVPSSSSSRSTEASAPTVTEAAAASSAAPTGATGNMGPPAVDVAAGAQGATGPESATTASANSGSGTTNDGSMSTVNDAGIGNLGITASFTGLTGVGVVNGVGLSPTAGWSLPFVLEVQTQYQSVTASSTVPTQSQATVSVGNLGFLSSSPTASASLSQLSTASTDNSLGGQISGSGIANVAASPVPGDPVTDLSDSFYERVPTGPLASRSAGPLGLIAVATDTTAPVDRHERALFQDIEGLGAEDEAPASLVELAWTTGERFSAIAVLDQSSEAHEESLQVVTLPGRGGFPMKVTAPASGQRTDLTALLGVLPGSRESQVVVPPSTIETPLASAKDIKLDEELEALSPISVASARLGEVPNYLKAACGLVLGLGLTSGPLLPGLIDSLRIRYPLRSGARRTRNRDEDGQESGPQ